MSETVIFIVGIVVFAITVYGAVMAGGLAMNRIEIEQNPHLKEGADPEQLKKLGAAVKDKLTKLEAARADVEALYARWEELDAMG